MIFHCQRTPSLQRRVVNMLILQLNQEIYLKHNFSHCKADSVNNFPITVFFD